MCPHYESRSESHVRAIAGTLGHTVVETREDNKELSDEDMSMAAECADFVDRKIAEMETRGPVTRFKESYLVVDDVVFDDGVVATTGGYLDEWAIDSSGEYAEMYDWKFGIWPVEDAKNNVQGISYVLGGFKEYPTLKTIRFFFKQPALNSVSEAVFSRDQIPELYLRIQVIVHCARVARWERAVKNDWSKAKPYVPACNFCANLGWCPKVLEIACNVGSKFHPIEIPPDITPTQVLDKQNTLLGLRLAQVVKIWADAFRGTTTERIIRGDISLPPGYKIQTQSRRELVDKEKFKETAMKYLTEDEFTDSLDVLFGAVEKAISNKAERGCKKAAIESFKDELKNVGATKDGAPYSFLKSIPTKE